MVGSGGKREYKQVYSPDGQRTKGILERGSNRTKGRKDKGAAQGGQSLDWPTFLVTTAKTNVEMVSVWGEGLGDP